MSQNQSSLPPGMRPLPFNAYRSGMYPQNKPSMEQAFGQYLDDYQTAGNLPQRMLYSKWKAAPAEAQFAQNAAGFLDAYRVHDDVLQLRNDYPGRKAVLTERMAGDALTTLPEPRFDPVETPVARGLSNQSVIQPSTMIDYIRSVQTIPEAGVPTLSASTDLQSAHDWDWSPLGPINPPINGRGNMVTKGLRGLRTGGVGAAPSTEDRSLRLVLGSIGVVGGALATYHGYRRTQSVGWALGWGFLGALFPLVTVPIALAQGFGDRKRGR